jgi:hypothetical protein
MPKQFSLRLMLAAVTALCIALSVWGIPAERQRRAVKAIRAVGGVVVFVERDTDGSETFLRRWLPLEYFGDVEEVWFSVDAPITDDILAHLEALPKLQCLWLSDTQLTDAGLIHLTGLTNLECLSIDDRNITNAGLAHLQRLTSLRELCLANTQATDDGISRLKKALPGCMVHWPTDRLYITGLNWVYERGDK